MKQQPRRMPRKSMSAEEYHKKEKEAAEIRWKRRRETIQFFEKIKRGEETYKPRSKAKFLIRNEKLRAKLGS